MHQLRKWVGESPPPIIFDSGTDNDLNAYSVNLDGYMDGSGDVFYSYIDNSYGIFISMIYYECDIDILYITITFLLFGGT